jgi:branched-chain amino acid transport system substrate-binding protein
MKGQYPSMMQAGVYSSVLHYLKALEASNSNGDAVVAKMKEIPTKDPLFGIGKVRSDGRKIHPMYLYAVKNLSESKYPWDYQKLLQTISAEDAFRPPSPECPLNGSSGPSGSGAR